MQKSGGVCKYGVLKAVYMQIWGKKLQKYFSAKNELNLFCKVLLLLYISAYVNFNGSEYIKK